MEEIPVEFTRGELSRLLFSAKSCPSCPTLCDPMDCSKPDFPVLHYPGVVLPSWSLLKLMSIELFNHLILCCPLLLWPSIFPSIRDFTTSQLASGGQSIEASALASVLPMNIQDCFPLGLIFLLSKELLRVFSSTTI